MGGNNLEKIANYYSNKTSNQDVDGYVGSGEFGSAYYMPGDRILKITTSKDEAGIANSIKGKSLSNIVDVYDVKTVKDKNENVYYAILMEELDTDSSIEDLFHQMMNIVDEMGYDINHTHMIDFEDLEEQGGYYDEDLKEFVSQFDDVVLQNTKMGIYNRDYQPDNLGYKKNGNLASFDMMDDGFDASNIEDLGERSNSSIRNVVKEEVGLFIKEFLM